MMNKGKDLIATSAPGRRTPKPFSLMAPGCSKNALDDVFPVRPRYVNLQKWAESDAEFVKRVTNGVHNLPHPAVVDSVSCRQMYLRSYTFSRKKETVPEKTKKCLSKVKDRVVVIYAKKNKDMEKKVKKKTKTKTRKMSPSSVLSTLVKYYVKRLVLEKKQIEKKNMVTTAALRVGFCMRRMVCVRKRVRVASCGILLSLFRRLLFCTTKVDVVD